MASWATGISDVPAATTIIPEAVGFSMGFFTEITFEISSNFAWLQYFLISIKVSLLDLVIKRFVDWERIAFEILTTCSLLLPFA